jgi:hypothetical protein
VGRGGTRGAVPSPARHAPRVTDTDPAASDDSCSHVLLTPFEWQRRTRTRTRAPAAAPLPDGHGTHCTRDLRYERAATWRAYAAARQRHHRLRSAVGVAQADGPSTLSRPVLGRHACCMSSQALPAHPSPRVRSSAGGRRSVARAGIEAPGRCHGAAAGTMTMYCTFSELAVQVQAGCSGRPARQEGGRGRAPHAHGRCRRFGVFENPCAAARAIMFCCVRAPAWGATCGGGSIPFILSLDACICYTPSVAMSILVFVPCHPVGTAIAAWLRSLSAL